jgi:hypothetical protein
VLPLAAVVVARQRERQAREVLKLPAPPRASLAPRLLALAAVPALLGLAATQPSLRSTTTARVRTDAQAIFVLDISRSMLAASGPTGRSRLARAKADAIAIRDGLPEIPSGVATFTDRILPDLFPDDDLSVFNATVERAVAINAPPPVADNVVATTLGAIGTLGTEDFFPPTATKRLVVVLTDGETRPFDPAVVAHDLASAPGVHLILVHVWARGEDVYDNGHPEQGYHEDDASGAELASLAQASGGAVFGEHEVGAAVARAKADLGTGPTTVHGETERTRTLAPYVALAALLPLLALIGLRRRPGLRRVPRSDQRTTAVATGGATRTRALRGVDTAVGER